MRGNLNPKIFKLSTMLMNLMLFLSFENYPNFLTKMLSLIQQKDHTFFQILFQSINGASRNLKSQSDINQTSPNQLFSDFCSRFTNQQFFESVFYFLHSTQIFHLFTLSYLDQLFSTLSLLLDQEILQPLFESIHTCLIQVYQSKDPNLLNDHELFRKVFQYFSKQEHIRNAAIDYLFSQISKNTKFVLNEISWILSISIEKESTIHHLSTIGFFDELFNIKQYPIIRLNIELLSSSLPFCQIPINNLIQLLNQQIKQSDASFKGLLPQWKHLLINLPDLFFAQFINSFLSGTNTSSFKQQFLSEILESIPRQSHFVLSLHQLYFE
jgi:hypothetical protein